MSDTISYILKSTSGQILGSLSHVLKKAEAHAKASETDEANFLAARLYPDMFPMGRQVQVASDVAARGAARFAQLDVPEFPDTETSFAELIKRVESANAFVQNTDSAALDAEPERIISLETPFGNIDMPKRDFLIRFVLPNIMFHASTAYGLLRHQGIELGKMDFLAGGQIPG